MSLSPGSRLGPYEVVVPLGAGGMGEVFLARDARVGREVALKVLPKGVASDPQKAARFGREAHLLAQLNHPNIAALYEFDEDGDTRFLVLEYVPGETLSERLRRGRPPVREALETARQMAVALGAAHERGIVHRDLKPANVKVTPDGRVKLLDFGLAKALQDPSVPSDDISAADTREGLVVGTAAYMSPEQARGHTIDARTDLWSFGCVLFELLTGRQAFQGDSISDVIAGILVREPAWATLPDETPAAARLLLQRCLQKDVAHRPADAASVAAELEEILSLRSAAAETQALLGSDRVRRSRRTRRAGALALGAVALAALSVFGVRALRGRHQEARPVPDAKVLAVLPFRDLTGRGDGQLVADGLAETLSAQLSRSQGVQILAPAVTAGLGDAVDPSRLYRQLGATIVLRGSVQRAGDLVRVSWLLLSGSDGAPLGGDTQTGLAADIFGVQDRVVAGVAGALRLPAAPAAGPAGPKHASTQERYLAALGRLQKYQDPTSVDAAVAELEALAAEEREWAPVHAALARAYLAKKLVSREPRWAVRAREACLTAEGIDATLPEVQLTMARVATASGDPEGAATALRKVLARQPGDVEALLGLTDALLQAGKAGEAAEAARRAVAASPSYWAVQNKLGVVLVSSGKVDEAIAAFRRGVELAPENARGLVNLGSAYVLAGRLPEAADALGKSVAVQPTGEGWSALGTVEYYRGRFDEAVSAYEKAVALAPRFSTLWVNLGDALRWSSTRERAPAAYGRAIEAANEELRVNPRDADAHLALALALSKTGRSAGARPHLEVALGADPARPDRLHQAAIVEAVSGRLREAAAFLHRAEASGDPAWQVAADPELRGVRASAEYRRAAAAGETNRAGPEPGTKNAEGGLR